MTKTFTYSALRFRPSYFLEEQVNIGLLFHFQEDNYITFIHPSSLVRLSSLHPATNLRIIKKHLSDFKKIIAQISPSEFINAHPSLQKEILLEDGNRFFFSTPRRGKYHSAKDIIDYYEKKYFDFYKSGAIRKRKDEAFLIKRFSEILAQQEYAGYTQALFKKEYKPNHGETVFDYAWQNGTTNLVKSISFDWSNKD